MFPAFLAGILGIANERRRNQFNHRKLRIDKELPFAAPPDICMLSG